MPQEILSTMETKKNIKEVHIVDVFDLVACSQVAKISLKQMENENDAKKKSYSKEDANKRRDQEEK